MLVFFYIYLKYACMRRLIPRLSITLCYYSTHLLLDSHSLPPPFSLAFLERVNFSLGEFVEKKERLEKGYQRITYQRTIIYTNYSSE